VEASDNIKLKLTRVCRTKNLDLYYFGPDGNTMYNTKSADKLDKETVRL
jgi:hypothetical protein